MNYMINDLPERTAKPRDKGITMVMDKGLSLRQVEDFLEIGAAYTDIVKLGWATSYVTPNLTEKIKLYQDAGIPVYFGGTLFEAFIVRNQFDDYCRILDKYKLEHCEVSDGSITIEHEVKCDYISRLAKQVTVISEVGSKDVQKIFAPYKWIKLMQAEIEAGSWKVIAEARESGNVGIYRDSGEVRQGLVDEILTQIPEGTIIWEAPQKAQQVWFIKLIGANVSLGNIAPTDIIPLETLRLGIRSDTFDHFLNL
ncbi:phosphosulfolactate synthase [Mucilaginibacter sp. SG564]|uniref:phosphosulfolactate synthase n=1 Tax=unclassified Mucilaginibacter TaxID=2617802 RepID=UPI00155458B0|nr:phosphosulfolactate synthase [Mucilaginibacter sp. SG564]NOW96619.1 phosphosulfolactate synthase [Mucilaginibacter sp. SG564]